MAQRTAQNMGTQSKVDPKLTEAIRWLLMVPMGLMMGECDQPSTTTDDDHGSHSSGMFQVAASLTMTEPVRSLKTLLIKWCYLWHPLPLLGTCTKAAS